MLTYKHTKHKHTVTAEDHETTKQAILVCSGWVLVPEVKTEEPARDEGPVTGEQLLSYVLNTDANSFQNTKDGFSASVTVGDAPENKPKAKKQ